MKHICVVTGSRAEYGLLKFLIKKIQNDKTFNLKLVVTGTHLSKKYGNTYNEIKKDRIRINKKIYLDFKSDKKINILNSTQKSLLNFSKYFSSSKFDLVVILGDRYEIFGAAIAAYFMNIPIAHFHGGEITEGLIDEGIRHSITKMSTYHFVSTNTYKNRVIQLGENRKNIFNVGALALDNILMLKYLNKKQLEKKIGFTFKKVNILFTYHPISLENYTSEMQIKTILSALDEFKDFGIIFTQSNADPDNKIITSNFKNYIKKHSNRCILYESLGVNNYFSCLRLVDIVVGNSSSGIIEVPSFNIPTINIGDRQKGRVSSKSVINISCKKDSIIKAIRKALDRNFRKKILKYKNPYKKNNTINLSFKIIKNLNLGINLKKKFFDIKIK